MSIESIQQVADQQTQLLLGVSGAVGRGQQEFISAVFNQQIKDVITYPDNMPELLGSMGTNATAVRMNQPPVQSTLP